jgi:hypothetical protein
MCMCMGLCAIPDVFRALACVRPAGNLLLDHWDPSSDDVSRVEARIGDWNLARRGDPSLIMWVDMTAYVGTGKRSITR